MLYGLQCWVVDRRIEQSMNVVEMRMLRWMSEVTRGQNKEQKCKR